MGAMTVAFVALALLALALIVVPRVQRARRGRVRRPRFAAPPRGAVAMAAAGAAPPSIRWHGSSGSRAPEPADELDDLWDDDLGWGDPEPAT